MKILLPQITQDMQQCIVKNPIIEELNCLLEQFEELQIVSQMAKFCILNAKPFLKTNIKHYTVIPIRIDKEKNTVCTGDIVQTNSNKQMLEIAAKCDAVALVPNGPKEFDHKYMSTLVNRAINTNIYNRYIIDEDNFHSLYDVLAYLGIAVIKHSYFWMSHEYCLSAHDYYRKLNEHSNMFVNLYNKNIYEYSMNHECVFGNNGNALMRIFDMSSDHFEHFLSMLYSQCNSFDEQLRSVITKLSTKYEQNPFVIQMLGSYVIITKLHTHEHYQYLHYKDLIDAHKAGRVRIDETEN